MIYIDAKIEISHKNSTEMVKTTPIASNFVPLSGKENQVLYKLAMHTFSVYAKAISKTEAEFHDRLIRYEKYLDGIK